MTGRPRLTVVIPTRDRPEDLAAALAATTAALGPDDDVLVVDSASADAAAVAAVGRAHDVPVLRVDRPGASLARNRGWQACATDLVAFTDDDCRPRPGWTDALREALDDPGRAFAFGRVEAAHDGGVGVSLLTDPEDREVDGSTPAAALGHGANMAVRRTALQAVDGFDEVLGAGAPLRAAEDKDLFWRLLVAGWRGAYAAGAVVDHLPRATRGEAVRAAHGYGVGEGALALKQRRLGGRAGDSRRDALDALVGDLRARYWTGAAVDLARLAGIARGTRLAARYGIGGGRFA